MSDGTHLLHATARDQAGNTTSITRTVIVDNTPPDTQITSGPTGELEDTVTAGGGEVEAAGGGSRASA